jgi:hypothetical protein
MSIRKLLLAFATLLAVLLIGQYLAGAVQDFNLRLAASRMRA